MAPHLLAWVQNLSLEKLLPKKNWPAPPRTPVSFGLGVVNYLMQAHKLGQQVYPRRTLEKVCYRQPNTSFDPTPGRWK